MHLAHLLVYRQATEIKETNISNKRNIVKNPNWQEADQLAIENIEKRHANIYSLKTLRTIFYFSLFIVFLGRFPYFLLSYFCYINVDSRGLKFSCNEHNL